MKIDDVIETKSLKNENKQIEYLLEKSIKKYGQIYPIIINSKNEIIKGNTIYKILKKLNYTDIDVKILDFNDSQLKLELNLTSGICNPIDCFKLMKDINPNDNCLKYSKNQINDFINLLNFDWKQYKQIQHDFNDIF